MTKDDFYLQVSQVYRNAQDEALKFEKAGNFVESVFWRTAAVSLTDVQKTMRQLQNRLDNPQEPK